MDFFQRKSRLREDGITCRKSRPQQNPLSILAWLKETSQKLIRLGGVAVAVSRHDCDPAHDAEYRLINMIVRTRKMSFITLTHMKPYENC